MARRILTTCIMAHTAWSSQSIKICNDFSIDKSIKIGKSDLIDLIDIDCIDQSVEIDDTLPSFGDLSWFLPISYIYLGRNIYSSVHWIHANSKFIDNWVAIESQMIKRLSLCCFTDIINYKEIFKKSHLFFKTRFEIFSWWLILARSVGAHFFRI